MDVTNVRWDKARDNSLKESSSEAYFKGHAEGQPKASEFKQPLPVHKRPKPLPFKPSDLGRILNAKDPVGKQDGHNMTKKATSPVLSAKQDSTLCENDIDEFARICKENMAKRNEDYNSITYKVESLQNVIHSQEQVIADYEKKNTQVENVMKDFLRQHSCTEDSFDKLRERYDAFHSILGSLEKYADAIQIAEKTTSAAFHQLEKRIDTDLEAQQARSLKVNEQKSFLNEMVERHRTIGKDCEEIRQQLVDIHVCKETLQKEMDTYQSTLNYMKKRQCLQDQQLISWKEGIEDMRSAILKTTTLLQHIDGELRTYSETCQGLKDSILSLQTKIKDLECQIEQEEKLSRNLKAELHMEIDRLNERVQTLKLQYQSLLYHEKDKQEMNIQFQTKMEELQKQLELAVKECDNEIQQNRALMLEKDALTSQVMQSKTVISQMEKRYECHASTFLYSQTYTQGVLEWRSLETKTQMQVLLMHLLKLTLNPQQCPMGQEKETDLSTKVKND
ncbi:hypothetical protein EC973_002332 [Apophysomyces ossiformis]|uniref:Uncharacterized protein n=1 Tax=Apophysomyces ossiformis TaxID=679940 RepID=A0A8H7EMN0_9FUNG|nr:hypothetical protein EC973_002332 [Apophysomyces ossiformis]